MAVNDIRHISVEKGFSLAQPKWSLLLIVFGVISFLGGFLFFLVGKVRFEKLSARYEKVLTGGRKFSAFFFLFWGASLFFLPIFELQPYLSSLNGSRFWIKFFIFILNVFLGASFLRAGFKKKLSWGASLAAAALAQLLIYRLVVMSLYISDYPFAIGWTRDSRYYYASLFFSEKIYGQALPLPVLHPSLHFIFSLPFLFGELPLWVYRAWSLLLTFLLTFAIAFILGRRFNLAASWKIPGQRRQVFWGYAGWMFLFLLVGSIYAHLLIPTLIIVVFFSREKQWQSWAAVIIASLWAGISRINWFPVPGLFAALLYFLETPQGEKINFKDLKLPALWFFIGTLSAFLSQAVYIQASGSGARDEFYTSFSSDLLWYRLLPNETYSPGILFGGVFLSMPLILLVILALRERQGAWKSIRLWGVISIVVVLFLGGLLVSAKIGGGADLHNLDAYFVSILLAGAAFLADDFRSAHPAEKAFAKKMLLVNSLGIFVLAWFILPGRGSLGYDQVAANKALIDLQDKVAEAVEENEQVLFVSQRHLLATGLIEGVPLVPKYEKDILMEMAMSRNRSYLDDFYDALRHQDFGLIVIDPQTETMLSEERSFAIENNRWILKITRPLLCYYEPLILYDDVGIELYVPRNEPVACD